jgi:hypothetical protein
MARNHDADLALAFLFFQPRHSSCSGLRAEADRSVLAADRLGFVSLRFVSLNDLLRSYQSLPVLFFLSVIFLIRSCVHLDSAASLLNVLKTEENMKREIRVQNVQSGSIPNEPLSSLPTTPRPIVSSSLSQFLHHAHDPLGPLASPPLLKR